MIPALKPLIGYNCFCRDISITLTEYIGRYVTYVSLFFCLSSNNSVADVEIEKGGFEQKNGVTRKFRLINYS